MTTYRHNREFQFYNCNLPQVVTTPKTKKGVENNNNRGYYWRIYGNQICVKYIRRKQENDSKDAKFHDVNTAGICKKRDRNCSNIWPNPLHLQ